jgi:TonB family protein
MNISDLFSRLQLREIAASVLVHCLILCCLLFLLKEPRPKPPLVASLPLLTLVTPPTPPAQPVKAVARVAPPSQTSPPVFEQFAPLQEPEPSIPVEENPVSSTETPRETADRTQGSGQPSAPGPVLPVKISGATELDNTDFSPIATIKPAYPIIALRANIQGYVDVDLVVDERGRVETFSIVDIKGHPAFGDETAKVITRWRFPPPRINGKKVKLQYIYRVNFTLN